MRLILFPFLLGMIGTVSLAQNAAFTPVNLNSYDGLAGAPECPTDIVKMGNDWFALIPEQSAQDAGRLYKSDNGGLTWTKQDVIFPPGSNGDDKMLHLQVIGNNLVVFSLSVFTNANNKLEQHLLGHVSTNAGQTFDLVFEKIYIAFNGDNYVEVSGLDDANGTLFFYYTIDGIDTQIVYFSTDQGLNWTKSPAVPWFCRDIRKITGDNGMYYVISENLMFAADNPLFLGAEDQVWTPGGSGRLLDCSVTGDIVRVCNDQGQVFRWNFAPYSFSTTPLPFKLDAAMAKNGFWYFNQGGHFYRAPWDDPANLTDAGTVPMIPTSYQNVFHDRSRFDVVGGRLFFLNDTPLESLDNGLSWQLAAGDYPKTGGKIFALNNEYWLQHNDVLFRSPDGFSWDLYQNASFDAEGSYGSFELLESQGRLFMTRIQYYNYIGNSRIFRSDDNGQSWQTVWEGSDRPVLTNDVNGTRLLLTLYDGNVGGPPQSLQYSDDAGDTWLPVSVVGSFTSMVAKGDTVFVYQKPFIKYTYNLGQTWQLAAQQFPFQYSGQLIMFPNGRVVLVDKTTHLGYMSPDGGQNFGQIFDLQNFGTVLNASNFTQIDSLLIAWSGAGTFVSKNEGLNWIYFFEGDWINIQHPVIQDGFLYTGSSGDFTSWDDVPLRTPLQPLLDQLNLLSDAGGVVKGNTFYDVNGDCFDGANEPPRGNEIFSFQPGNYVCTSDPAGNVARILPQGSYQMQFGAPLYHDPGCLTPGPITVTPGNQTNFTLGFKPNQQIKDLVVMLVSTRARPGLPFHVTALIRNIGTQPIAAGTVLTLTYPEPPVLFTDAQPQATNQAAGQLQFVLPDIPTYSELNYKIHLALPPDPGLMGQVFQLNAGLTTSFQDPTPTNNATTHPVVVFNSFDPNDKTAITSNPTGVMPIRDQSLQYMIRFQNTGTDTAFRIVVRDTLSGLLNWHSLKTLGASHDYRLTITDAGVASWHFDDIRLVDSTTNERESHGFILFGIEPKPGIRVGDILRNKAAIYFDFNHPVITNETATPIVLRSKYRDEMAQELEFRADILPNPIADQLRCRVQLPNATHVSAILFGANGQAIRQVSDKDYPAGEHWLEARLPDLPAGVYSLHITVEEEMKTLMVVKR